MADIKVIQTKYNGVLYRSRTEARWARFFDECGIRFYYEYETFKLPSGELYLPDFYLPHFAGGTFAEVKGGEFTKQERIKLWNLLLITSANILFLDGPPSPKTYKYFEMEKGKWPIMSNVSICSKGCKYGTFYIHADEENKIETCPDCQRAYDAARNERFGLNYSNS